ncbi:MAG TPA: hypothetical protein VGK37_16015 [Casimicrobiaceae bacterium]
MNTRLSAVLLLVACALLTSCVYYGPHPGYYTYSSPSTFDRAWNAALGALQDAGIAVASADPATGIARGSRNGVEVTVSVTRQADGTTRVQFDANSSEREPGIAERFSQAYERRMGR